MVIGVTGGVGAGKSTVLKILRDKYDAKLILTDDVARELMAPGGASYDLVRDAFGDEILLDDGGLDRGRLAGIVFEDEEKLELLNSITHPQTKEETRRRITGFKEEDPDALVVVEAALLIEAGFTDLLDELWVVTADRETRIRRLEDSRCYTRQKCEDVMANQLSDEEFESRADFVIDNSGNTWQTEMQIARRLKRPRNE